MSHIGKNIKKIRRVKKLSQTAFAALFNMTRASIGSYEEGRAEPKIDTIILIAKHFSISIDKLLTKELTVNELYHFDIFKDELKGNPKLTSNLLIKKNPETTMAFVSRERTEAYIASRDELNDYPGLTLPLHLPAGSRAFEHQGHEMQFADRGLLAGDMVVGCKMAIKDLKKEWERHLFVVVTQEGIYTRRLQTAGKELVFSCDNPNCRSLHLKADSILEVWEVRGAFSTRLQNPFSFENRLNRIESQLNT